MQHEKSWSVSTFFVQKAIEWLLAPILLALISRIDPTFLVATCTPTSFLRAYLGFAASYSVFFFFMGYLFFSLAVFFLGKYFFTSKRMGFAMLCFTFTASYLSATMYLIPHGFFDHMVIISILTLGLLHAVIVFLFSPTSEVVQPVGNEAQSSEFASR